MSFSEDEVRAMVRRVLYRTLGPDGIESDAPTEQTSAEGQAARSTVTETDVLSIPRGGQLVIGSGTLITPLALDTARDRQIEVVAEPHAATQATRVSEAATSQTLAVGADHGGYALKEELKGYLDELGYDVVDCGTNSTASVDYPDFAYAVARLVADGRAWRGIIIDGAGIGSCMAANKVPGVRAAMCYDHATAVNSREHNDANVLALGGLLLGHNLVRQIVQTWLATDFAGGRHARRVDKITGIEKRFLRG
jgi:ribose 5-phosphate isomerase B